MLRNNSYIQGLADKCAQQNGFVCASYLGRKGEVFIYEPIEKTSEVKCTDLPPVIAVEDGQVTFVTGERVLDILCGLKFRDYKKGRQFFREMERKVDDDDFASEEERDWICEIVYNQRPSYEIPVNKTVLYKYLEVAARMNMKLELVPYDYSKERNDGWGYYLELMPQGQGNEG